MGTAAQVFLDDVILSRTSQLGRVHSLVLSVCDIKAQQPRCSRVNSHGRVHLPDRDFVEQGVHLTKVVDGNSDFSHFAASKGMIRVVASLSGQIECYG